MRVSGYSAVSSLLRPLGTQPSKITDATLSNMIAIARKYQRDVTVIDAARRITANVPQRNTRGNIETLQAWVRDHIKYVNDPRQVEMVQTPPRTLSIGTGDCDDKAVLLATLLESMGYTTRFVAIAENSPDGLPSQYSHVMAQVRLGQRWINLETILPGVGVGWFPPDVARDPPPMVKHV